MRRKQRADGTRRDPHLRAVNEGLLSLSSEILARSRLERASSFHEDPRDR